MDYKTPRIIILGTKKEDIITTSPDDPNEKLDNIGGSSGGGNQGIEL